ncbi:MAG: immune inhibitor A [Candidatus Altiarchaeota archaeon]|nr:immune inhibitor A [Candidatus Altiarchaeota archaeon]
MERKGFIFTLAAVLLIIPLLLLVEYYATSINTKSEDTIAKIRCDELHYFVQDINKDLERAMGIFGRRAAIYGIDSIVISGDTLEGYRFNCTSSCGIDCSRFAHEITGSPAAIDELIMCGTMQGRNISYMENHTLSKWMDRIIREGDNLNFNVTMQVNNITVVMYDAWNFAVILNTNLEVEDKEDICFYKGTHEITAFTSILGLEDVLYPINTNGQMVKFIENCSNKLSGQLVAGCSEEGAMNNETGSGVAVFYSDIKHSLPNSEPRFCNETMPDRSNIILIIDTAAGSCNQIDDECFNSSWVNHIAGVIDEGPNDANSIINKCDVSIPWILDTGAVDNYTDTWETHRANCSLGNITQPNITCVSVKNQICPSGPATHEVLIGFDPAGINTSCYRISDMTSYACDGNYDGPSFLDRLDGRYNLSEFYRNQSRDYFNNTRIGIETLISPYDFALKGIAIKENESWVDYLYWMNVTGCPVVGSCGIGAYKLKLDCAHAYDFQLDTECVSVNECPNYASSSSSSSSSTSSSEASTSTSAESSSSSSSSSSTSNESWYESTSSSEISISSSSSSLYASTSSSALSSSSSSSSSSIVEWMTPHMSRMTSSSMESSSSSSSSSIIYLPTSSSSSSTSSSSSSVNSIETSSSSTSSSSSSSMNSIATSSSSTSSSSSSSMNSIATSSSSSSQQSSSSSSSRVATTICGLYDDMETEQGWTSGGTSPGWIRGAPSWGSAYSGSNTRSTNSASKYTDNANEWVHTPIIDITATSSATLTFQHRLDTENCGSPSCDNATVEISTDNGDTWTMLKIYGTDVGSTSSWIKETIPLDFYTGENIMLQFRFVSDDEHTAKGWVIDDLNLSCT